MNKRGWVLSNNENGDIVIQKDDESDRFKSDDEATQFVVESYNELLETLKITQAVLSSYWFSDCGCCNNDVIEADDKCQLLIDKVEGINNEKNINI